MQGLNLVAALLLPWAAGAIWLRTVHFARQRASLLETIAYGHLLGIVMLTLIMRAASALNLAWSFPVVAGILGGLVVVGTGVLVVQNRRPATAHREITTPFDPFPWRWLAILAAILLSVRVLDLGYEVLLQPLYPWDAWTQWATKAKVWSALHSMVPFIDYSQWLAREPGYIDAASHYPGTVPLLQAWMALALGTFDDVLVNLPWLALCIALIAGTYAQTRAMGAGVAWSLFVTYAVASLPLLDTHVALAGYADLYVAAAFALGLIALLRWERAREPMQLVYLGIAVALLPTLKVPGVVWAATLLLGLLIAIFGASRARVAGILLATGAATAAVVFVLFGRKIASVTGDAQAELAQPLVANLFLFDNWHLLWYLVPVAFVVGWRDAIRRMRGTSAALVAGFAFLWATFALTRAGAWVADYTTVNRALLHIAPATVVYTALLLHDWAVRRESAKNVTIATAEPPMERPVAERAAQ